MLFAALVACAIFLANAGAGDQTEASTFGVDGTTTQSLGASLARTSFESVLARPDGNLLARQDDRVVALLASGALDPTFAPIPARTEGSGLFPAAGGKAFVVDERKVTRLNPDGTADAGFGQGGTIEAPAQVQAVGETGSGKIVLAETGIVSPHDPGTYISALLLNQDGSPVGIGARSDPSAKSYYGKAIDEVLPSADGGALIVGSSDLFRLNADGSRDQSFGHDGLVSSDERFVGARLLADGSVEVVGSYYLAAKKRVVPAVFRYTASGDPDGSFGRNGVKFLGLPEWDGIGAVLWGADGSAVIGGHFETGGRSCGKEECEVGPAVAALDPDGNLDPGFGEGGQLRLTALAARPRRGTRGAPGVTALTRRPDGSIVAVGGAPPDATIAFGAAFSPQGALLPSFGEAGLVRVTEPVPARQRVDGMVPLPDGKLLATGASDVGIGRHPILARYDSDGSLDPSFGDGTGYLSLGAGFHETSGFAVRGGLALIGLSGSRRGSLALVRMADGSPVTSFGRGGKVDLLGDDSARALAFASDGDPIVLDSLVPSGYVAEPVLIQRFDRDGGPDRAFGHGGKVLLSLPGGGLKAETVVAGPGGRVFVGGFARRRYVIGCLLPDGRLDPGFGSGGWSTTRVRPESGPIALARQGRRLYLAGITRGSPRPRVVLVRFDLHGHPDRGFGRGGTRAAAVKSVAPPTAIIPTRAGVVVILDHGSRPVITFARHAVMQQRPIGAEGSVGDVRATVSLGRLIVGWVPRSIGLIYASDYHLSARQLEP